MSTARTPLGAIRENCLYCSGGSAHEVKLCQVTKCPLYEWRFGKNPYREKKELTIEQREKLQERFARGRSARVSGKKTPSREDFQAIRGAGS